MRIRRISKRTDFVGLASYKRFPSFFGDERKFLTELDSHFDEPIPLRMLDLMAVACATFVQDCHVRRPTSWARQIRVTVEVHDLAFWQRCDVLQSLQEVLKFTGDSWEFDFVHSERKLSGRPSRFAMRIAPVGARVFLATEGADSFSGINVRLSQDQNQSFLGVNGISSGSRSSAFSALVDSLEKDLRNRLSVAQVPLRRRNPLGRRREEQTQRSRTFLLLTLASIFACASGDNSVEIYENGIEAFNFPLLYCFTPATFSRAMNPLMVASMKRLASLVSGQEITFKMPFLFHTKAQLISEASSLMAEGLLGRTVSCARFPAHIQNQPPCGVCSGCILRRVSLIAAGLSEREDVSEYQSDIFSEDAIPSSRLSELRRLETQMEILRAEVTTKSDTTDAQDALLMLSQLSWQEQDELIQAAAMLTDTSESEVKVRLLDMYMEYGREWFVVAPSIKALGNGREIGNESGASMESKIK